MYREIKELLKLAAVHAPLYGFLKMFCTFLSALFIPANALLLQRILNGLVSFSCSGRLPADWYRDLVWMAGLLLGEGLLTGTDGLLAVRFEMQVTDRLETRLMEKLRNLEYSRMEEPQIQDLLSEFHKIRPGKSAALSGSCRRGSGPQGHWPACWRFIYGKLPGWFRCLCCV